MKRIAVGLAGVAVLVAAQEVVRPAALAERETWPEVDQHKSIILEYAHPVLGRELTADILWAQTLVYYGTAQLEDGDFRYLEPYLDAILELDPRFKRVYHWAAYAVTYRHGQATQEEFRTSLKYLHMAMEQYPNEHRYTWLAGTRYFLDLQPEDPEVRREYREKGAALIEEAMRMPDAPALYAELAAAFRTRLGQHERAIANLEEKILTAKDARTRRALLEKLRTGYREPDIADELERRTKELEEAWRETAPYAPPAFFFLLGEEPDAVIDFDELATERDLFGVELMD